MASERKPIICFYCREEIPDGWPVTFHQNDEGNLQIVHRFRNMCASADVQTKEQWHTKEILNQNSVTDHPVVESNEKGDKKK